MRFVLPKAFYVFFHELLCLFLINVRVRFLFNLKQVFENDVCRTSQSVYPHGEMSDRRMFKNSVTLPPRMPGLNQRDYLIPYGQQHQNHHHHHPHPSQTLPSDKCLVVERPDAIFPDGTR